MKGYSKGHDPELGKKFMSEHSGSVIGFGRSSQSESEPDQYSDLQEQFNEEAAHRALAQPTATSPAMDELEIRAGKQMVMGRAVQNVQMAMRAKGKLLGAVSPKTILEMVDKGEIEDSPSVQAIRQMAAD